jgi:tetratricopeptide (TPR) repeat protein
MQDLLQAAVRQHQLGRLQDAGRMYQNILARNPNHADALHLLGVVAHQLGHQQQAAELISRAIALEPGIAAYHANLGEVWRTLGQLDRAIDACRTALRLQPTFAAAENNLGLALLTRGELAEAIAHFRAALDLNPDFAMAYNNLANGLRLEGDIPGAIAYFREAVQRDPQMAEAHSNLGQLLCERNELKEALGFCREAVRLKPDSPEALSNLGNVLRARGQIEEAKQHYLESLRLNPSIGMVYNNMAQAMQEEGNLEEAFIWYQKALERDPNTARIHANLASALEDQERHDEAIARYQVALRLEPASAEAHSGLGFVYQEQGRDDEARAEYEAAIRVRPDFAIAHCNLGNLLEELNDLKGAEACFRTAIQHDPNHCGAHSQLAILLRGKLPDNDLAALRRLLDDPELPEAKRSVLRFGLAQALDARGRYTEAAEHLRHANADSVVAWSKRGDTYDPAIHTKFVADIMATCAPEFFERARGWGSDSERPVFIFGLPRSGTTLVEQVLASHSQVFGAGEQRFTRDGFESLPTILDSSDSPVACLSRIDQASVHALAQRHLQRLRESSSTAARVVDKMPDNYLYLGLLAILFPRAKLIHCRRDLRDVAVSCWMTNFRHIRWAGNLDHMAARFHEYQRLMEHWRTTLPLPILEVFYEETVEDLERVARQLVDWCGLEWEPACLAFHETKRPVRTASVTQVRQPLYKRSVARWKHYEAALGSLFAKIT